LTGEAQGLAAFEDALLALLDVQHDEVVQQARVFVEVAHLERLPPQPKPTA
jgi:hypothetical protein